MSAMDEDFEHWPTEHQHWTAPVVTAPAFDAHFQQQQHQNSQHTFVPPTAVPSSPQPPPQAQTFYSPSYFAHPAPQAMPHPHPQPHYFSHPPQQPAYMAYPAPGAYYTYAAPQHPPPVVATAPPFPQPSGGASFHVYQPAYSDLKNIPQEEPAPAPGPPGNVWLGRTRTQVEEDNMKIAAREGAYDKHKIAPVGVKDEQIFWVVELDGSHSLREFRHIKTLNGTWKKDPRFEDSYYFVCEEKEEMKK